MAISTGPSIRAVCRIINQNSCGSGSVCGVQGGKSLILTNAHVAGTKLGRVVKVEHEQTGDKFGARVIMASYSDKTTSDWAVLETVDAWVKVKPVKLSKKPPTGSHYTKGFPRCRAHNGTDITTVSFAPPVWFWEPDAIGGQSGSGVWSDGDGFQYGLLTWQWNSHGAGQLSSEIYKQKRSRTNAGYPRPEGLIELTEQPFDFTGIDRAGCDDPVVESGFFAEASIATLPIWAEDDPIPPPPDERPDAFTVNHFIEFCRSQEELYADWRARFEGDAKPENDSTDGGPTYGL